MLYFSIEVMIDYYGIVCQTLKWARTFNYLSFHWNCIYDILIEVSRKWHGTKTWRKKKNPYSRLRIIFHMFAILLVIYNPDSVTLRPHSERLLWWNRQKSSGAKKALTHNIFLYRRWIARHSILFKKSQF